MIKGIHAMFYTPEADAARAFLRDKLGLKAHDVGEGWLIFDVAEGEVGCHPAEKPKQGISFYCDDLEATMAELQAKGVTFAGEVKDEGWGLVIALDIPGGLQCELYQPRYKKG